MSILADLIMKSGRTPREDRDLRDELWRLESIVFDLGAMFDSGGKFSRLVSGTVLMDNRGLTLGFNQASHLRFKDSTKSDNNVKIGITAADRMFFLNKVVGGGFGFSIVLDGGAGPSLIYREDPGQVDRTILDIGTGEEGGKIVLGGSDVVIGSVGISGGPSETVFNDNQEDIDFRIEGDSADVFKVDAGLDQVLVGTTMAIKERADQQADIAGYGQLWVKSTTPCELWFTDDTGTDTQLA